jgi:hypothetical protein
MVQHFEELWEHCEKLHKNDDSSTTTILDELSMKINLYKMIDSKTELAADERQKVKTRTMGEILLTLTSLSLKDNINVFDALNTAAQYRSVENLNKIPKDLRLPKT